MPLEPGSSNETVSKNIKEMMASGHPQKQAVAASLKSAGKSNQDVDTPLKQTIPPTVPGVGDAKRVAPDSISLQDMKDEAKRLLGSQRTTGAK